MIITINSLTPEGKKGLMKYFPETTFFNIKCKLNNAIVTYETIEEQIKIIVNKKFSSDDKDKTFVVYMIKDMKKEQGIEILKDYNIEVQFQ